MFVWKYWITGVISAIVIALGCIGNITAIVLLHKPKMSTAFNQLLIVLCVFDTVFLISNIPTTELALQSRKYIIMGHRPHDKNPLKIDCNVPLWLKQLYWAYPVVGRYVPKY